MSHFYGIISDSARKTQPTARAHNRLTVEAQSFQGKIVTTLDREKDGDGHWVDLYEVWRKPHQGSGGESVLLAKGRIDQPLVDVSADGREFVRETLSDLREPNDITGDLWK
jgi:hypothetical protein